MIGRMSESVYVGRLNSLLPPHYNATHSELSVPAYYHFPTMPPTPFVDAVRLLLWAGGLRDLPNARPGEGYTGHSFNDHNHCDLTAMLETFSTNENKGQVQGIGTLHPFLLCKLL